MTVVALRRAVSPSFSNQISLLYSKTSRSWASTDKPLGFVQYIFWESCQAQISTVLTGSQLTFAAWVVVTPLEQGFSSRDDPVPQHTYGNVWIYFSSFQVVWRVVLLESSGLRLWCCSVTRSRSTLCNPMDCSRSGFPVLHHLLEFAQTHVHWVGDAIQQSCLLLSPSPAFNLSLSGRWNAHPITGKMP